MAIDFKTVIHELAARYFDEIQSIRRHLHAHPELSYEEFNTSAMIGKYLTSLDIPHRTMANTGVIAVMKGDIASTKVLALRADLDALPITEVEGRSYGSIYPGVMHACGHDVHTASLIGVIKILQELKPHLSGTVKFIFQPGEEKLPGGASIMIKEGVLENPKPDAIIGQHVMPMIESGKVGFRPGKYMASCDELYMTVRGRGGHAAHPHQNIDPITITAQIISALQQIVSRTADPRIPTVLSWGKIIGMGATNVIPDEVKLEGTFRTFDEKWRSEAHIKLKKMAISIAEAMGASCDLRIEKGYPFLINEPHLTKMARVYSEEYLGKESVEELDLWPAAEDFAYYSQVTDACFYRLGTGHKDGSATAPVHTASFDIDESALKTGMGLMAYIAIKYLQD